MVLIDMPMPDRCLDCPFFKKHSDCGQCKGTKKGKWIEPEDYDERQVWCPLKETHACDLINRQDAIDVLIKDCKGSDEGMLNMYDIVCDLKDVPSAQPGWIPTWLRFPDIDQWVLCQCRAGITKVLRRTKDGSWDNNDPYTEYMGSFVVAWMPLPEPYKGGDYDG